MLPRRAYDPCRIRPVAADVDHVDGGPLQLSDEGRVVYQPGLENRVEVLCHAAVLVQAMPHLGGQARTTDDPTVVAYDDPGVITGGTDRFADAGGTMTTRGLANLATGEYTGTITGSVSDG